MGIFGKHINLLRGSKCSLHFDPLSSHAIGVIRATSASGNLFPALLSAACKK